MFVSYINNLATKFVDIRFLRTLSLMPKSLIILCFNILFLVCDLKKIILSTKYCNMLFYNVVHKTYINVLE